MIDIPTLIGCSVVLFGIIGLLFLLLWLREGRRSENLWFCAPYVMGVLAGGCLIDPSVFPQGWAVRLGATFVLLAYAFGWQAVRAIYGRPFPAGRIFLPVAIWLCLSLAVFEPLNLHALNASTRAGVVLLFNAVAALELWRRRGERLPSGSVLFAVFACVALFAAIRIPFTEVLPTPLGVAPTRAWAVVAFNLMVVMQSLLVAALIISMLRERLVGQHLDMALRDPLTGVYNRRALDWQAGAIRAGREGAPVSLLLFDIDHFKAINDRFGHAVGDQIIVFAARAAEETLKNSDRLYRIGGDEFVCLLPGTAKADAAMLAERLRLAFQRLAGDVGNRSIGATVSIGVASSSIAGAALPLDLLVEADRALYRAKERGRNRVIPTGAPAGLIIPI